MALIRIRDRRGFPVRDVISRSVNVCVLPKVEHRDRLPEPNAHSALNRGRIYRLALPDKLDWGMVGTGDEPTECRLKIADYRLETWWYSWHDNDDGCSYVIMSDDWVPA